MRKDAEEPFLVLGCFLNLLTENRFSRADCVVSPFFPPPSSPSPLLVNLVCCEFKGEYLRMDGNRRFLVTVKTLQFWRYFSGKKSIQDMNNK